VGGHTFKTWTEDPSRIFKVERLGPHLFLKEKRAEKGLTEEARSSAFKVLASPKSPKKNKNYKYQNSWVA
jgi:hypothetical protein